MLSKVFNPESVAVVGATDDTAKLRGKLLQLVLASGFSGRVYPVNPGRDHIQGLTAYANMAALPEPVDLVLIAAPGDQVPAIVRQAGETGASAAVIFSSGVPEAALTEAVTASGMRVMGPNTEGFFLPGSPFAATFAQVVEIDLEKPGRGPRPGRPVSIVSQSGGLGFALYGRGVAEHLDFHSVITTGNELDIECLDVVDHLLDEGRSGVIVMFIEGLKTPERLAKVAAKAADLGVPLVVMKVGRSEAGQRAAVSHTAHLTGADTAYDAVFERYGVLRVLDIEEMLAVTAGLARLPLRRCDRTVVVTTSGGAGAWAADLCGVSGLDVPELSPGLQTQIGALIPAFGSAANPVDVTGAAVEDGGKALLRVLEALATAEEVDAVVVNMGLAKFGRVDGLAQGLKPLLNSGATPILFHSHILPTPDNLAALADLGGHGFPSLRGCALALKAVDQYARFLTDWRLRPAATAPSPRSPTLSADAFRVLGSEETRALLESWKVPMPGVALAQTAEAGLASARAMGFPVALKIQSPDIPHKTEAGGVALHVEEAEFASTFEAILQNAKAHAPAASIEGVSVQQMAKPGHEVVVGVVNDPDFGPLIMLGSGGIYLEVLKDVVFAPLPICHDTALALIDRLKTAPILKGARGQAPADLDALARLVVSVAELAAVEAAALDQIDLNPVFVYPAGEGVMAVDSLVAVRATAPSGHAHSPAPAPSRTAELIA